MIKMRIDTSPEAVCGECGNDWGHTREMYDIVLFGRQESICKACSDTLFRKLLRASCMYDGKVKTKEDKERARREMRRIGEE